MGTVIVWVVEGVVVSEEEGVSVPVEEGEALRVAVADGVWESVGVSDDATGNGPFQKKKKGEPVH